MPNVLEFTSFHLTRLHGLGQIGTFQGLDACHLIGTRRVFFRLIAHRSGGIDGTHRFGLLLKHRRVFLGRIQPVAAQVRLKVRLVLRNARPAARRW